MKARPRPPLHYIMRLAAAAVVSKGKSATDQREADLPGIENHFRSRPSGFGGLRFTTSTASATRSCAPLSSMRTPSAKRRPTTRRPRSGWRGSGRLRRSSGLKRRYFWYYRYPRKPTLSRGKGVEVGTQFLLLRRGLRRGSAFLALVRPASLATPEGSWWYA